MPVTHKSSTKKISNRIVIVGASGHGSVACDAAESQGSTVAGFLDSNIPSGTEVSGYNILGRPEEILNLAEAYGYTGYFVAISNNATRASVSDMLSKIAPNLENVRIIHSKSIVSEHAIISDGALILAGAIVNCDCVIGSGAIVNTGTSFDHGSRLEPFSSLLPGVSIGGNVTIGEESCICIGSTIVHNKAVGRYSYVGAGSLVLHDIPDNVLTYGSPAKIIRVRERNEKHF